MLRLLSLFSSRAAPSYSPSSLYALFVVAASELPRLMIGIMFLNFKSSARPSSSFAYLGNLAVVLLNVVVFLLHFRRQVKAFFYKELSVELRSLVMIAISFSV